MSISTTKRRLWTEAEIEFVKDNPQMPLVELGQNVTPCCFRCNEMKNNKTTQQWVTEIKQILRYMGETL